MKIVVSVKAGAREDSVSPTVLGYKISVKAPPIDGRANQEVIRVLAKYLNIPKSCISIFKGHTTRHKILNIDLIAK